MFSSFQNDAVFWYNLKKNGKGNPMTRHAACPVLVGQKWGKFSMFIILTHFKPMFHFNTP